MHTVKEIKLEFENYILNLVRAFKLKHVVSFKLHITFRVIMPFMM